MPRASFDYDFNFRITGDREVIASLDTMIKKGDEVVQGTKSSTGSMSLYGKELQSAIGRLATSQRDAAKLSLNFLRTSDRAVQNMAAQNRAIIEQARRRGSMLVSEETILRKNVARIDEYTDFIRQNSSALNVNSKIFEGSNRVVARNESVMRSAESAIESFSFAATQAQYKQELWNDSLSAFQTDALIVNNQIRLLSQDVQDGTISVQAASQAYEFMDKKLREVIVDLERFIDAEARSAEEVAQATSVLVNMRAQLEASSRAFNGTSATMRGMNTVASGANQLMLSFGDIVQDSAQFSFGFAQGARAIGNNIAFAAEQFVIMQANMVAAQGKAVTFGATMKALGGALMGPIGLIVLLNAVVTGVTIYATRQERLNKELKDGAKAFDDIYKSLKNFSVGGLEFNLFEETNIRTQIVSLKAITDTIKLVKDEIEDTRNVLRRGGTPFEQVERELKPYIDGLESIVNVRDEIIEQFPILKDLDDAQLERFLELEKQSLDQQKVEKAKLELFKQQVEGGAEYIGFLDEIKELNQDLTLSEAQRELGLTNLAITQDDATIKLEKLKTAILTAGLPVEMLNNLLLELAETQRSLADETEETNEALEAQYDIRERMRRQLAELRVSEEEFALKYQIEILKELPITENILTQIKDLREQQLEIRKSNELLSESEIALEKFKINSEYEEALHNLRLSRLNEYGNANEQLNQQLASSVASMFSALMPESKLAAITMLALEKAMVIGKVIADTQQKIASIRSEQIKLTGMAAAFSAIGMPVMAKQYGAAVAALEGSIGAIKASGAKSIAKIAAIGLAQGIALASSGGSIGGGRGGGTSGAGAETGGGAQFGFESRDVKRSPRFMPKNESNMASGQVKVEILADRKQLYAIVRRGQEEYRQIAT